MVFENPTFFELHLHLGEDDDSEPETPLRSTKGEPEDPPERRLQIAKILALVGVSIGVSVLATVAARRAAAKVNGLRGRTTGTKDKDEAVLEITE